MATQSKLWSEGNESKNKTYIGRVSRAAGGKTVTREWEGLVDRQGDGGGGGGGERERERVRTRRDGRTDRRRESEASSAGENAREAAGEERMAD